MKERTARLFMGLTLTLVLAGCGTETAINEEAGSPPAPVGNGDAGSQANAPAPPGGSDRNTGSGGNSGGGGTAGGNSLAPTAAPAPVPAARLYAIEAGAQFEITLDTELTSDVAQVGDRVTARLAAPARTGGKTLLPAGTLVEGSVTEVKPAKRFGGQAMVAVGFDTVRLPSGRTALVEGTMAAYARKQTGKDAGTIAGGTAGGALLGKVLGGEDKDAGLGAVVGGAIGTAIASRRGDEALLPSGSEGVVFTRERITSTTAL